MNIQASTGKAMLRPAVEDVEVDSPEWWLHYSDHMPVVVGLERAGPS